MQRQDTETIKAYKIRLCSNKDLYELTWPKIVNLLADEGEIVNERSLRAWWTAYLEGMTDGKLSGISDDTYLRECELKKQEWQKEKIKVQTEKLDLNRRLRESARIDLFLEYVDSAIAKLDPIAVPEQRFTFKTANEATCEIADAHYGSEFTIKGLRGEIINEYSPEIFERRMWQLRDTLIDVIKREEIYKLYVLDLGDCLDGLLHVNQLLTLKYGLVDSAFLYSEFIANWLNDLSKYCHIEYRNTKGNHTETRPYNSKRGEFPDENFERIVAHIVKLRVANNNRITVYETETNAMYFNCAGLNILGCHGQDERSMDTVIADYERFYNVPVDIVFEGHLHRSASKTISAKGSVNTQVIQVPSLVGTNTFAAKHKWSANAGAKINVYAGNNMLTYDVGLN